MKSLSWICIFACIGVIYATTCYRQTSRRAYRKCGFWGLDRCGYNVYSSESYCCDGWTGDDCNEALCDNKTNPDACSLDEGYVQMSAEGPTYTSSGGTCVEPDTCEDCNPGYYSNGSYCRACTEIDNCYYSSCTSSTNSVCQYCKGVVLDDETKYGWWAYTRWMDGGLSCKPACSWRAGSRCYPGSCSDTTLASCACTSGFSGTDCTILTEEPSILGSSVEFKHSTEVVQAPADISSPPPQDIVYTNQVTMDTAEAYVDAQYIKPLPSTPDDFYVIDDKSLVGIVDGGVSVKLVRGASELSEVSATCPKSTPVPTNYRCQATLSLVDNWSSYFPLAHKDRILFSAYATNGGYITVYDRENNNAEVKYEIEGESKTYSFEVKVDTEMPYHCDPSTSSCSTSPLDVPDLASSGTVLVQWDGWSDAVSGLDRYHLEVFKMISTGPGETSELKLGDKVPNAITETVAANIKQTTLTLITPGIYSVILAAYDKAGNYRLARGLVVYDNQSKVDKQGSKTVKEGTDGQCTWEQVPAAPIVTNANPDASGAWLVKDEPIHVAWQNHFINTEHHNGQYLNPVATLDYVESWLDDLTGIRQLEGVDNVLGIVKFQVSYESIVDGQSSSVSWSNISDIHSQSTTINPDLVDGMALNISIRALDIFGAYADESVYIKVDTSPPFIADLWLTLGNKKDLSVHNMEDLSKMTFEWDTWDFESGIYTVAWRIFDNYTGIDYVHGTSFQSPQGNTETLQECKEQYGLYPGGANCYCTPLEGCYHRHYYVQPQVDQNGTNGLALDRYTGTHDAEYFIEVTTTNRAMVNTVMVKKISIDVSPPTGGTVLEGMSGSGEVDYQQDKDIHVYWKDFHDKESGIIFYDYIYGTQCYDGTVFSADMTDNEYPKRTYLDFASFTVSSEGTYYVTVVAYNRALDHSVPVCSDGVIVNSAVPSITNVTVARTTTVPGPVKTDGDGIWYLNEDRSIQPIEQPDDSCISKAFYIGPADWSLYTVTQDSQGREMKLSTLNCDNDIERTEILSFTTHLDRIDLSWTMADTNIQMYNTEIGLGSIESDEPDIVGFESAYHHTNKRLGDLNLVDGQMFMILIKTTTKSGVTNVQKVGPFLTYSSAPTFNGEIETTNGVDAIIVSWSSGAFADSHIMNSLKYEFAVGTTPHGSDIQEYGELQYSDDCPPTDNPTCTAVDITSFPWSLHHLVEYFITIKATNKVGLSVTAVSPPYVHNVLKPANGVVFDVGGTENANFRHDADFQLSTSELEGEWFGFESSEMDVNYTICQAKDTVISESTCKYVGHDTTGTITGLSLTYFTVYQMAVIARAPGGSTTVYSNGIMPVDTSITLDGLTVYDGPPCGEETEIDQETLTHHEKPFTTDCHADRSYQISLSVLSSHWTVPDNYATFTPDVNWKVQRRTPLDESWEDITEDVHTSTSMYRVTTKVSLESGRKYRFVLTFCANELCFPSLHTNGVTVLHYPPKTGSIDVELTDTGRKLAVTFDIFVDPGIEDIDEAREVISYYEWAITDHDHAGHALDKWLTLDDLSQIDDNKVHFERILDKPIQFSKCWHASIRGYNKVGLYSAITKDIHDCADETTVKQATVVDCVGPSINLEDGSTAGGNIEFVQSTRWTDPDKDYTPYNNIISAVWPTLRYLKYSYAVIEMNPTDSILFHNEESTHNLVRPCDVPFNVACGHTEENFINVHVDLIHGHRYTVCIHANSTTLKHEKWDEHLEELTVCSDGITVDITPPTPGLHVVYINGQDSIYQQSLTDIHVIWESFVDVEELSKAVHQSGIIYYEVAIGTHEGERDVHDFVNVNITNHFIFHGLSLKNGQKYYAVVKGHDFTGKWAEAYSAPIITDNTPPVLSNSSISTGTRHILDGNHIDICWSGLFSDEESGISYYEYAIGSRAGYDDIFTFTKTSRVCFNTVEQDVIELEEGHLYYISVKGYNGAGLSTITSSWAINVDYSPPTAGLVLDGTRATGKDVDYQTDKHTLSAYWRGFQDPHTNIEEYFVAVGTSGGLDDVVSKHSVGTKEEVTLRDLHLREGQGYYITVTACNTAELCTSISTDGVIIDSSAPAPGIVKDGTDVNDIDYQSSRRYVACKWFSFVDAQSGISHYTWRLGTSSGADDVVSTIEVHSADMVVIPDIEAITNQLLPEDRMLYSTVRAYNKAGLWSEATSSGFLVDTSAPVFQTALTHSSLGSLRELTSVLKDAIKLSWDVQDDESYIDQQYLTILPHLGEDFSASVQVPGHNRDYTFTEQTLHDGSVYDIKLWSCNGAKLCSKSELSNVLVDSTRPTAGSFAIHTDRAAALDRQPDWMSWTNNGINVALVGFYDEHSGISDYHINVGSTYMASDLNTDTENTIQMPHDESTVHYSNDGGKVQIFTITTTSLGQHQYVFLTVWADNGVGLSSEVIHGQFKLNSDGSMELVRRCSYYSCQGHCVCAAQDQKCPTDSNTQPCNDVTADAAYATLAVTDLVNLRGDDRDVIYTHSPTHTMLAGQWEVTDSEKTQPEWYEYSVGLTSESEPQGIVPVTERFWFDAARRKNVVFTLGSGMTLHSNQKYSIFVRAWYDGTSYSTYKSPGVTISSTRPQTSALFERRVKEKLDEDGEDVDFCKETHTLLLDWTDVFKDAFGTLSHFNAFLSTIPGGHGPQIGTDIPATTTSLNLTVSELSLRPGLRYFTNVQAYTKSGLHTSAVSDGFTVDTDLPFTGVIFDGTNLLDLKYQNHSDMISAHWHGFSDQQSGIQSYVWCVSSAGNEGSCDIVPSVNLGMETSVIRALPDIANGQTLINEVEAIDAAGSVSIKAVSNGVTTDKTAPVCLGIETTDENHVLNPSFEQDDDEVKINAFTPSKTCTPSTISSWDSSGCVVILTGRAKEGSNALWVRGNVSQTISGVIQGHIYAITFYVTHLPSSNNIAYSDEVLVQFGDYRHIFKIHSRPGHSESVNMITWQLISGTFEAHQEAAVLTIGTMSRSGGILIDEIAIAEMTDVTVDGSEQVQVHSVVLHDWSSIHASWKCVDDESGIKEYMWAIGTARGGIQLQNFESVGRSHFASNSKLNLPHQTALYITVLATNGADLQTVFYSSSLMIDRIPPVISMVYDGPTEGVDLDFQGDREISFTFAVEDSESGIKECSWMLGTADDHVSVLGPTKLPANTRAGSVLLSDDVDITSPLYVTVECINNVGLVSAMKSDGIQVLLTSPDTSNVVLDVLVTSLTQYPARDYYQSRPDELRLRWSGFRSIDNVKLYKVDIQGDSYSKTVEVTNSGTPDTFVKLDDLQVESGNYICLIRGVNVIGTESDIITKNFTIVQDPPQLIDENGISLTWNSNTETLTVAWQGMFHSQHGLYYEISVGTTANGADIIKWQETVSQSITLTLQRSAVGEFGIEIFVVLTAISPSGTYRTTSYSQLITE